MFNPCLHTDAGRNYDCAAAFEYRCLEVAGALDQDGFPISLASQIYPPNLAHLYPEYLEANEGQAEYFPGSVHDQAGSPPSPGPAPSFVWRKYTPPGAQQQVMHYFVNIRYTKNEVDHAPGTGLDWRLYWMFACSRCQEGLCCADVIECENVDGGGNLGPGNAPRCGAICGDAGLLPTDAAGLHACIPN